MYPVGISGDNFSVPKSRGPYRKKTARPATNVRVPFLGPWRLYRGLTVAELAEGADLSDGTISGLENGTVGASIGTLRALADALDCTVGDLFEVDPFAGDGMWSIWANANKTQRNQIIELARVVVRKK